MTHQYMEIKLEELEKRIKALEQEPCEDAISRERLKECFHRNVVGADAFDIIIDMQPSVQTKTGHWIDRDASGTNFYGKCSCCGQEIQIDAWYTQNMKYCPNCGAKMVEPQESEG